MKTQTFLAAALITSPVGLIIVLWFTPPLFRYAYVGFLGSAIGWLIRDTRDLKK